MDADEPGAVATLNGTAAPQAAPSPRRIPDPLPAYVGEEIAAYCTVSRFSGVDIPGDPPSDPVRVGRLVTPFALELIAQRFGAGRYMLQWHDAGHKYLGRSRIALEAPQQMPGEVPWQTVQAGFQAPSAAQMPYYPPAPNPIESLLQRIVGPIESLATRMAQLEARVAIPPAPPPGLSVQDMLGVFQAAATLVRPADPAMMETYFKTGMRLAREAAGDVRDRDDGGGVGWPAVIAQLGPGILEALNRMIPPTGVPVAPNPALPAPATAPQPAQARENKNVPKWLQALIEEFRRGIAAEDDPGFTADWIVRNVPEQFVAQLCADNAEETLATYAAVVPELGTDKGREFSRLVLTELRQERAAEAEPAREG